MSFLRRLAAPLSCRLSIRSTTSVNHSRLFSTGNESKSAQRPEELMRQALEQHLEASFVNVIDSSGAYMLDMDVVYSDCFP